MNFKNALSVAALNLVAIFIVMSFSDLKADNIYADAICPEDSYRIVGKGCFYTNTDSSIIFIDYDGNLLEKTEKNDDKLKQEIIISKRDYEILNELLVITPKIKSENMTGKALEQKIFYDSQIPTVLTRNNFYFGECIKYSIKNAESAFYYAVHGKEIHNSDFGKNNKKQIEYSERYDKNKDPFFQNTLIKEKNRAEETVLKIWGNFTNR